MLLYSVCTILPQHYKDRVKTDSVREEELKQCLVEWESGSYFQKGNPYAITNYINEHLRYNPKMLGNKIKSEEFTQYRLIPTEKCQKLKP